MDPIRNSRRVNPRKKDNLHKGNLKKAKISPRKGNQNKISNRTWAGLVKSQHNLNNRNRQKMKGRTNWLQKSNPTLCSIGML